MPVAIGGVPGILQVHTIAQPVPLLLPIEFCWTLGMQLDLPAKQVHWTAIDRTQDIVVVGDPNKGHCAVDIFEFQNDCWHSPFSTENHDQSTILGSGNE